MNKKGRRKGYKSNHKQPKLQTENAIKECGKALGYTLTDNDGDRNALSNTGNAVKPSGNEAVQNSRCGHARIQSPLP